MFGGMEVLNWNSQRKSMIVERLRTFNCIQISFLAPAEMKR